MTTPGDDAMRARAAHAALCARFERPDGSLRRDGRVHLPGTVAHVWPFARALVATLDVVGIQGDDAALDETLRKRLSALERYWDDRGPAYASDPPGTRGGGDIYYDDNAWVALALVQLQRLTPADGRLDRLAALAAFARGGWSEDPSPPAPGGIFWVQQGRGAGMRNHDRNAISTAPNAAAILHLAQLTGATRDDFPDACADWVDGALTGPGGLIRDKIRGDGSVDIATWSYNQGSRVGLGVGLARSATEDAGAQLASARGLAVRALDHYAETAYAGEPPEFVAIFVRNLLALHAALADGDELRPRIVATLRERADAVEAQVAGRTRPPLLAVAAAVSLRALCAWAPGDYGRVA